MEKRFEKIYDTTRKVKKDLSSLSIFGGASTFQYPLRVGQMNLVEWDRFEAIFRNIFLRRYYTNHGPMAKELESQLCNFLGVQHAVCMSNATIGLIIAAKALDLIGKVIVPAFTYDGTVQSVTWAGLEPLFCDINPETHHITSDLVEPLLNDNVHAILGVHMWGNACDIKGLEKLARRRNVSLYFDASDSFGCTFNREKIGNFGELEIFSFHASNIINALEGGCVCTNDDYIAARLRHIRSSYGADYPIPMLMTSNGRMSEAQAAMALLSLADYQRNRQMNQEKYELYHALLKYVPGIRLLMPREGEQSNYQNVVMSIEEDAFGISRDNLISLLNAENVFCQRKPILGMHRNPPYNIKFPQYINRLSATDAECSCVIQVPSGQQISMDNVRDICGLIVYIHEHALEIHGKIENKKMMF